MLESYGNSVENLFPKESDMPIQNGLTAEESSNLEALAEIREVEAMEFIDFVEELSSWLWEELDY